MNYFYLKWVNYIRENNIDLDKVICNYYITIKEFIESDYNNEYVVEQEVDLLTQRQAINNYAKHKNGMSQLKKLIDGWLLEDIVRLLLDDWAAVINGADFERKVGIWPTNEPDIKFSLNNQDYYIEVTGINKVKGLYFRDHVEGNKFKSLRWWQARSNKLENLKNGFVGNSFILNVTKDFEYIMVKRIVSSNTVIKPRDKWASYIGNAIALDDEYIILNTKGQSLSEISDILKSSIIDLIKGV